MKFALRMVSDLHRSLVYELSMLDVLGGGRRDRLFPGSRQRQTLCYFYHMFYILPHMEQLDKPQNDQLLFFLFSETWASLGSESPIWD